MILQTSGKTDPRHSSVTCQNNSVLSDTAVRTAITLSLMIFVPPESQWKNAAGSSWSVWLTEQQTTVSTTVNKVMEMVLLTQ
jgi:hypothetical protein